jgi:Prokaryotic dksA/traR C4-type zinc finger
MTERVRGCEICGKMIEPERAKALPATRLCIEHGREIQKYGGEFQVTSRHIRTSKEGSLKKNFGGVDVEQRRNRDAIEKLREEFERTTQS